MPKSKSVAQWQIKRNDKIRDEFINGTDDMVASAVRVNSFPYADNGWIRDHAGSNVMLEFLAGNGHFERVIYSFDTPIAWKVNGEWTVPRVRYSQRTSVQQGWVRVAIVGATKKEYREIS